MSEFSTLTLRIYYHETDNMGVVYYANYLKWFEIARTEFLRERGISYADMEKEGLFLPVVNVWCNYFKPVIYDDIIEIKTFLKEIGKTSLSFLHEVYKNEVKVAEGGVKLVCINSERRPVRIPESIRKVLKDE